MKIDRATDCLPSRVHDWLYCCEPSSTLGRCVVGSTVQTSLSWTTPVAVGCGAVVLDAFGPVVPVEVDVPPVGVLPSMFADCIATDLPLAVLMMMSANWSGSVSRPSVLIVSWNCCDFIAGGCPTWPETTCRFWALMALTTSEALRLSAAILSGSSQARRL